MKRLLGFFLLLNTALQAQEPFDIKSFQKEFKKIHESERRAFERFQLAGSAGDFTVATDNFDVHHIRATWFVDPAVRYISGNVHFDFFITQSTNSITLDLIQQLIVDSVLYHGSKISFQQTPENGVVITFPATITAATADSVTIFYQGTPPTSGFGSFNQATHGASIPIIWTLSEPYGSRDWWPCKNGLTDKTDSIDIYITCPQQYQPSSNGIIISNTVSGADRITHFRHRYPVATYLIALAVTNYQINADTVVVGNKVDNYLSFGYPESPGFFGSQSWSKTAYRVFNMLFGPYPFAAEKYGHTQFGGSGGMEHQTNSFVDYTTPNLSAHELAHQWFGDLITCGSWQDIWLNEGFATYCTLLFIEYGYPSFYWSTLGGIYASASTGTSGSVFVPDTSNVGRIFSSVLSYNKGAYVLHMLRWVTGDSAFYRGVRRYLEDPALKYGYARTADLQRNLEDESGKDLNSFFQKWVYGEGYPNYHAEWAQNTNGWVKVKLNQTTTHPSVNFYEMPVQLLLRGPSQGASFTVEHQYSGQDFWINPGFAIDTIIIDPDFHILSKVKTSSRVNTSTTPNDIRVYPNPSPGQLYVSLKNPTDSRLFISLYNSIGQLIYKREIETTGRDELIEIPAAKLSGGTYFLKIKSEKGINVLKKIVR